MSQIKPVDDITSRDLSSSGKKLLNEVAHIYHCSAKFCSQNPVILLGISIIGSVTRGPKKVPHADFAHFQVDQQKTAWFECDFCVSSALYIFTLLKMGLFCM